MAALPGKEKKGKKVSFGNPSKDLRFADANRRPASFSVGDAGSFAKPEDLEHKLAALKQKILADEGGIGDLSTARGGQSFVQI